jgi:hypothetical protein
MSKDKTGFSDDKRTHTMSKYLDNLKGKAALTHQNLIHGIPGSTTQLLYDHSELWKASAWLTKEMKKGDLDAIVQVYMMAMIGVLNIYIDKNLAYSWEMASEIVAKIQGHGMNHAKCIVEWVMGFLRWRDLPLHGLNQKWGIILNDDDIAEAIKMEMTEKARKSFLKAEDVTDIIAGPKCWSECGLEWQNRELRAPA